MLRAIFFDAAGTLFDAREPVGHTYARIARKHGLDATDEAVTEGFRRAFASSGGLAFGPGREAAELRRLERGWWREVVKQSFIGLGEFDDFDAFFDELFAYFAEPAHWEPIPEAPHVLSRLRHSGLKLGVISNFDYRLYRILEGLGLDSYFDTITISSEAGFAKPAGEVFALAMERLGVEGSEAAHVGDSEHMDFAGARKAGMAAVLIQPATGPLQVDGREGRIPSLASIIDVVQVLRSA
jgi:putative hydrolase of the HAD superfamily